MELCVFCNSPNLSVTQGTVTLPHNHKQVTLNNMLQTECIKCGKTYYTVEQLLEMRIRLEAI